MPAQLCDEWCPKKSHAPCHCRQANQRHVIHLGADLQLIMAGIAMIKLCREDQLPASPQAIQAWACSHLLLVPIQLAAHHRLLHIHTYLRHHPACCMAQVDDTEVINFLLSTEIIPLCLRTMEMGSELSKTVATFIVQKILQDSVSLSRQ